MKLLVKGIGQLVTVAEGASYLAGKDMANIKVGKALHLTPGTKLVKADTCPLAPGAGGRGGAPGRRRGPGWAHRHGRRPEAG